MGKNLKGKETGRGISQRKDGLYCAGFVNQRGKRQERCLSILSEARNWSDDVRRIDEYGNPFTPSTMTTDDWFEYWINHKDLVFINWRTGEPAKNSTYDTHLYKLCDEAGIKQFCMHTLRHTRAARAIESGMQQKVLQKPPGHAGIKTAMDRYVHVTDDSLSKATQQFEEHRGG